MGPWEYRDEDTCQVFCISTPFSLHADGRVNEKAYRRLISQILRRAQHALALDLQPVWKLAE